MNLQGSAGTLLCICQTKRPFVSPHRQTGAWRPLTSCCSFLTHTGVLWAEAPVAGDLELLRLLQDPTWRLTVVRTGRWWSNALLWRSGGARCGYCCGAWVLANGPGLESTCPWKPLAANGVGLGQSSGVSFSPRSAGLSPPHFSFCSPCWSIRKLCYFYFLSTLFLTWTSFKCFFSIKKMPMSVEIPTC